MPARDAVIQVEDLVVEYKTRRGMVRALNGITFSVKRGECVGFIGPNGAGKSSTLKTLMGFHFPSSGQVRLFGHAPGDIASRQRTGYLPEVSLYYPFMKGRELLELYGGLQGLTRSELKQRIPDLLERVGLSGKGETYIREYSKGMQQRLGIAQAIIADPELLIFDEMSSGLDPVGRYDLRQVLVEIKDRGATIFFSSHELHEVAALCDRMIIINHGKIIAEEDVPQLMASIGTGGLEEYVMNLIRPSSPDRESFSNDEVLAGR